MLVGQECDTLVQDTQLQANHHQVQICGMWDTLERLWPWGAVPHDPSLNVTVLLHGCLVATQVLCLICGMGLEGGFLVCLEPWKSFCVQVSGSRWLNPLKGGFLVEAWTSASLIPNCFCQGAGAWGGAWFWTSRERQCLSTRLPCRYRL